jgi:predicted Ser/Thr protein kinase
MATRTCSGCSRLGGETALPGLSAVTVPAATIARSRDMSTATASIDDGEERQSRIESLLIECLDRAETEGADAVEDVCRSHPECAEELRRQLELLAGLNLFGGLSRAVAADANEGLIGGFRLLRRLGEGSMGVVYLAEQTAVRRLVALKILRVPAGSSPGLGARLEREAQSIARLRHPHIVTLYAAGEEAGMRWLAMEFVPGRGLDEILAESWRNGARIPVPEVVRWGRDLARALAAAHAAGIVHRDVKPSNVRITPEGRAMLLDFGLARDVEAPSLTRTGEFQGSPHYASPEQVGGATGGIGRATDVYSLGVTLYEAATGRLPFAGETIEQVFQRILVHEPPPARQLDRAVPRDVETVLLRAMEKDPRARYGSAAAFADDLDAIAARRSSPLVRLQKWGRRHPAGAAVAATAIAAAVVLVGLLFAQARGERERVSEQARAALVEAKLQLDAFRRRRTELAEATHRVAVLLKSMEYNWLDPREDERLDREQAMVERGRREGEMLLVQDLEPRNEEARRLRAELYAEKFEEASSELDAGLAAFYRDFVLATDADGPAARRVLARTEVTFATDPPGADVHLFRYRTDAELRAGGEPRLVPVPIGGADAAVAPGAFCLRVVRGAGDIRVGDLIVAVAGQPIRGTMFVPPSDRGERVPGRLVAADGRPLADAFDAETNGLRGVTPAELCERGSVDASVWHDGAVRAVVLPEGLTVRTTATPLPLSAASLVGRTPTASFELEPGSYLAVLRCQGCEDLRYPFVVRAGPPLRFALELLPDGTTPAGFVHVPPLAASWTSEAFWLQERELTCAEYLEFLNDPTTRAAIAASSSSILVPRDEQGPLWPRSATGEYQLGRNWAADWPVLAVSWHDAEAYARWRSERARASGSTFVFALPRFDEWKTAGHGADGRDFVFGWAFRPKWMKSNYARPRATPESVLRFPVDESVFGAFDLAGSALEWLDDWYREGDLRRAAGGGWGQADPNSYFRVEGGLGLPPTTAANMVGFRLVARRPS